MEQQDFSRFWRVPEGGCELLAARYSARAFGRHSHERYAVGVIGAGVEKLFYRGTQHLGTAGSIVTLTPAGKALLDKIEDRIIAVRRELLAGISQQELTQFEEIVHRISANALGKIGAQHEERE